MKTVVAALAAMLITAAVARADELVITVYVLNDTGMGEKLGSVTAVDTEYGLMLTPSLTGLTPGLHGFHVHEHGDCSPAMKDGKMVPGLAAGGHYDPAKTGKHLGPYGDGHLGDLPPLYVAPDGSATLVLLAPRLKVKDLAGHSLMIHAGGDNFSDEPAALGGGGARVACGMIESK
jgi:Cu-Zn family superoxide dismutase